MNKRIITIKFIFILAAAWALSASANVLAAPVYRVSTQFFHLGELIGKPMLEVEAGVTAAGEYSVEDWGQYTIAVLVRPAADGQVFVSMQFTSGKIDIQPNLLAVIGQPRSATIDKVRLNLLVEEIGAKQQQAPGVPLRSLTQDIGQ